MFSKSILSLPLVMGIFVLGVAANAEETASGERQSPVVLDENLWVTFYDLPSRRFRAIRAAVLTRDFEGAARDLAVTANYLSVEADRSSAVFQGPLQDVVGQMRNVQADIESVTLEALDKLFGRSHWLLAQHYLELAGNARNSQQNRNASLYLYATTHHLERAMLWSNVAVTRDVYSTLEGLQELASDLQDPATSAKAYKERPVVRAGKLLRKIGEQIDRRVLLPPAD